MALTYGARILWHLFMLLWLFLHLAFEWWFFHKPCIVISKENDKDPLSCQVWVLIRFALSFMVNVAATAIFAGLLYVVNFGNWCSIWSVRILHNGLIVCHLVAVYCFHSEGVDQTNCQFIIIRRSSRLEVFLDFIWMYCFCKARKHGKRISDFFFMVI